MPREDYQIGDVIDYIAFCISNDGATGIEVLTDVNGDPQITHNVIRMREGVSTPYPLATAAINASKPPTAIAGQVDVVLQPADLDEVLVGDDDLYIKTVFVTAEGNKTFLMVLDVQIPETEVRETFISVQTKTFAVGDGASPVVYFLTDGDGNDVPLTVGSPFLTATGYFFSSGTNAGTVGSVGTVFSESYESPGLIIAKPTISPFLTPAQIADNLEDGAGQPYIEGDVVYFEIRYEGTVKRFGIPFEAPIVGAPFVLG